MCVPITLDPRTDRNLIVADIDDAQRITDGRVDPDWTSRCHSAPAATLSYALRIAAGL
jgi:hypothetical protein